MLARLRERDLFEHEVLAAVGSSSPRIADQWLDGFLAMEGHLYDRELMVVGRAVNGWGSRILGKSLADPVEAKLYANEVFASVSGYGLCPMAWVSCYWPKTTGHYSTASSAFWRVIREVTHRLSITDVENASWPSRLVWSNLYKVSPDPAGNPNAALRRAQLSGCLALLQQELSIYRPRRVLFLTGRDWASPFMEQIGFRSAGSEIAGLVEAVGTASVGADETAKVVVAVHPQGKNETDWVAAVMAGFRD